MSKQVQILIFLFFPFLLLKKKRKLKNQSRRTSRENINGHDLIPFWSLIFSCRRFSSQHREREREATMAGGSASPGTLNPSLVKVLLAVMALSIATYILGPPLYWHLAEALGSSSSSCPTCSCDCSSQPLLSLPEGSRLIDLFSLFLFFTFWIW